MPKNESDNEGSSKHKKTSKKSRKEESDSEEEKKSSKKKNNEESSSDSEKETKAKKKDKKKEKAIIRKSANKESKNLSDSESDEEDSDVERSNRSFGKGGKKSSKKENLSDSDEEEGEEGNVTEEFLKDIYVKNNLIKKKSKDVSDSKVKKLFHQLIDHMLYSQSIYKEDKKKFDKDKLEEWRGRAISVYKNYDSDNFLSQKSGSNVCVAFKGFPKSEDDVSDFKISKVNSDSLDKYNEKGYYFLYMTTQEVKSYFPETKSLSSDIKFDFVTDVVRLLMKTIYKYCDKSRIDKVVNMEAQGKNTVSAKATELVKTEFSDDDEEPEEDTKSVKKEEVDEKYEERKVRFLEHVRNHEPSDFDHSIKTEEHLFQHLYGEAENENRVKYNFYHENVPCVIQRVIDGDTFELLCAYDINKFANIKMPNGKRADRSDKILVTTHGITDGDNNGYFMLTNHTRLMFFDFVEAYTLPGAAMALALTLFSSNLRKNNTHCHASFRGEDVHGRELAELYINGRGFYQTLKKLNIKHPNSKEEMTPVMIDYDGTHVSKLSKQFNEICKNNGSAKLKVREDSKVKKLANKYLSILEEAFLSEEPNLKKIGKDFNASFE